MQIQNTGDALSTDDVNRGGSNTEAVPGSYTYNSMNSQVFTLTAAVKDQNMYNIRMYHSGKYLDVANAGIYNGTNVQQYQFNGAKCQKWFVTYVGGGDCKIMDVNSEKLLSITASSPNPQANVQIWYDDGTSGQFFKLRLNADSTYTIQSKCSGYAMVLDVNNYSTVNGANVEQYYDNNTTNQKFIFENLTDSSSIAMLICNIDTGKYMQPDNNGNTHMEQHSYSQGNKKQIWQ